MPHGCQEEFPPDRLSNAIARSGDLEMSDFSLHMKTIGQDAQGSLKGRFSKHPITIRHKLCREIEFEYKATLVQEGRMIAGPYQSQGLYFPN